MCNEHLVSFTENVAAFSTEDYGPPGSNPKHNPHPPPPNFPSENVAAFSTEDYGPPGPNPKHNPPPPPHTAHVVDVNSPPNPDSLSLSSVLHLSTTDSLSPPSGFLSPPRRFPAPTEPTTPHYTTLQTSLAETPFLNKTQPLSQKKKRGDPFVEPLAARDPWKFWWRFEKAETTVIRGDREERRCDRPRSSTTRSHRRYLVVRDDLDLTSSAPIPPLSSRATSNTGIERRR
ncbi:hypothetical protein FCV25MIE_05848 [Fagus crenata]